MKIAVIWARFGPYHIARLTGAARAAAASGARVIGIEVARRDAIYAWDEVRADTPFERVTLAMSQAYEDVAAAEIRRRLIETLERHNPDVVAVNGWSVTEARAAIGWCASRPSVRAVLMSESKADDKVRPWWKEVAKSWLVTSCDTALVGGRPHADYLAGLGFPRGRIFIGYDVVDNVHFARGAERARQDVRQSRAGARLPEHYFLASSRFIARKNIDGLLRAYGRYRQGAGAGAWSLVILGSGEEAEPLQRLERELQLEGVIWPGFVQYDALPTYYALASAFIHPALSEPWGLVVNEAAASGLPLLVSHAVGAASELLTHEENGYGFDPTSIAAMATVLERVASLPEQERMRMGQASTARAARLGPDAFGRGLIDAASTALAAPKARARLSLLRRPAGAGSLASLR